jgi:anaerobic magnesium-protoporphyrin IX monomethyl ester cyclase
MKVTLISPYTTVRPEECLEHADLVCVGEGEDALRELVVHMSTGDGYAEIPNIWYERDGAIVRTPLRPLASNLDAYPYPSYDLNTEHVLHQGRLQPMTKELLLYYLGQICVPSVATYETFMSRGCHYRCAYCANNALARTYAGEWRVRRRSVPHVIGELKQMVARFPEIQYVQISDDLLLDDLEKIREFSSAYKQAIGIPFLIGGLHPAMVEKEKISLLADAGMN